MSRWSLDPQDDDAYDIKHDGTACEDCGRPSVAWLCETCSDQRDAHTSALEQRLAAVVDVALLPVAQGLSPVVNVALVPVVKHSGQFDEMLNLHNQPIAAADARFLKRMAKAILSADLSHIQEVA